ncbi:MAG: CRISPR-associated endoribonuclease Cas6 [Nanoarchaeota archaeon]
MRLLIELTSLKQCAYDLKYYHKLRGFLYGLQKDSKLFNRHELESCKFFSFSNIFPAKDMQSGEKRAFIVSCPDTDWIDWLRGKIERYKDSGKPVEIGEMQFKIESVKSLKPKIGQRVKLIAGTPIVLRIPREKYKDYDIQSERPFEYWRATDDFNAFLKQLNENLLKKYHSYYGKKISDIFLFEEFKFNKEVCVHRIEEGIEIPTIGTLWEFQFNNLNNLQRKILEFSLDSGFGELNSSGFGFMNVCREKQSRREEQGQSG